MRLLIWIPIALALAGCTADGGYVGPARPFDGSFSTITVDVLGRASAYKSADELPIGYLTSGEQEQYSTYRNRCGVVATGLAAEIAATTDAENLTLCAAE